MIWADKVALTLCLLWVGFLFAVFATDGGPTGFVPVTAKIFVPLWLFLRLIDWMLNGPARRRGRVRAEILH